MNKNNDGFRKAYSVALYDSNILFCKDGAESFLHETGYFDKKFEIPGQALVQLLQLVGIEPNNVKFEWHTKDGLQQKWMSMDRQSFMFEISQQFNNPLEYCANQKIKEILVKITGFQVLEIKTLIVTTDDSGAEKESESFWDEISYCGRFSVTWE